jgi:hypothetical protein
MLTTTTLLSPEVYYKKVRTVRTGKLEASPLLALRVF